MNLLLKKLRRRSDAISLKTRKLAWAAIHNNAPNALPVFVLGAQRSGTNMLGACLKQALQIEYYPEKSPIAFDQYKLKSDDWIRSLITRSRYKYVVFKPLTDSHRAAELLNLVGRGKVLWMFRRYEDRANSAVKRFGDHNLRVLADLAQGRKLDMWQAQGLLKEDLEFVREFDYGALSPKAAAAVFWYLRNKLFFNQALQFREDVYLVCYEELVKCAEPVMQNVCGFIGCEYRQSMVKHIFQSSLGRNRPPEVDPRLHMICSDLYEKLRSVLSLKQ